MALQRAQSRRFAAMVVALASLTVLASCGDDDDDEASPEDVCDERDVLETRVANLREVDVAADGTDQLRAALDDVRNAVDDLGDAAGDALEDEIDGVESAVDGLRSAVEDLDEADSPSSAISSVSTAVTTLAESFGALRAELDQECA